jgi:hypothetical protein
MSWNCSPSLRNDADDHHGQARAEPLLTIRTFGPPPEGLAEEGERLLDFAHADAAEHDVRLERLP